MQFEPYPEELRETPAGQLEVQVFQPQHHHVVMGASGKAEQEVYADAMQASTTPLFKRKGGGGTVLLGPETIVVTLHAGVGDRFKNLAYFEALNHAMIDVFRSWHDLPYQHRGISDIAVDDRKIVGTSIFRRRQYLLFQASILVSLNLPLMERLLRPPPREPDYRKGRDHSAFVTCLRDLGITQSVSQMIDDLRDGLPTRARLHLGKVDDDLW